MASKLLLGMLVPIAVTALASCASTGAAQEADTGPTPSVARSARIASTDSTASPEPAAETGRSALEIRRIESRLAPSGAQDLTIEFSRPVPDERIAFDAAIDPASVEHVLYRTQEWTPDEPTPLWTCGDAHGGFSPPATVGQVDVLMPADWFEHPPDSDEIVWVQDPYDAGLKTPLCGPHSGYVQLAIWGPSSHDPGDVTLRFEDHTQLVVEIRPQDS